MNPHSAIVNACMCFLLAGLVGRVGGECVANDGGMTKLVACAPEYHNICFKDAVVDPNANLKPHQHGHQDYKVAVCITCSSLQQYNCDTCTCSVKNGVVILFICLVLGVTIIYCCCFCYHAEWCLWRAAMNKQKEEVIRRRLSSTVSEGRTAQYPF